MGNYMEADKKKRKIFILILLCCMGIVVILLNTQNQKIQDKAPNKEQQIEIGIEEDEQENNKLKNGKKEDENKKFDVEKTPVSNMVSMIKLVDSSNFCEEEWFTKMKNFEKLLTTQYEGNKDAKDPLTKKLLNLQKDIINAMSPFTQAKEKVKVHEEDIKTLKTTYQAYHDAYYQAYPKIKGGKEK